MQQPSHIIRRQLLEFTFPQQEGAKETRDQLTDLFKRKILPEIAQTLDTLSPLGTQHRIEKLELDLGRLPYRNLEQVFVDRLTASLKDALQSALPTELLAPQRTELNQAPHSRITSVETDEQSNSAPSVPPKPLTAPLSPEREWEVLIHFLTNGLLPWWFNLPSPTYLYELLEEVLKGKTKQIERLLLPLLKQEIVIKRMLFFFPSKTLVQLATFFLQQTPLVRKEKGKAQEESTGPAETGQKNAYSASSIEALKYYLQEPKKHQELLVQVFHRWAHGRPLDLDIRPGHASTQNKTIRPSTPLLLLTDEQNNLQEPQEENSHRASSLEKPAVSGKGKVFKHQPLSQLLPDTPFADLDSVLVANAGLVLLWPHLPHFFHRLGLMEGKSFKDDRARAKAALVLQALVGASSPYPEYLLPLNKALCGIPVSTPIPLDLEPSAEINAEVTGLLEAVIQQWKTLGSISPKGFQRTFLQREGVLRTQDGSWYLTVEKQTHDVLLEWIPWAYNTVSLSWMEGVMYVEW